MAIYIYKKYETQSQNKYETGTIKYERKEDPQHDKLTTP
jgi:hypothetical protein